MHMNSVHAPPLRSLSIRAIISIAGQARAGKIQVTSSTRYSRLLYTYVTAWRLTCSTTVGSRSQLRCLLD
jgi:hypothetical protein